MSLYIAIVQALWFVMPAYAANAFPAVVKGKKPIDFGRNFGKNRLLGDSKTIKGTFSGVGFGMLVGFAQISLHQYMPESFQLIVHTPMLIILLSTGALLGDIIGSFIKRRLGINPGESYFPLDQLGFLVASLALASIVYPISFSTIVILIVVTPVVHIGTNVVGYLLKLKKHPW